MAASSGLHTAPFGDRQQIRGQQDPQHALARAEHQLSGRHIFTARGGGPPEAVIQVRRSAHHPAGHPAVVGWRAGVERVRPGHGVPEHASLHRAHAGLWISPRHLAPHRTRALWPARPADSRCHKRFGAPTGEQAVRICMHAHECMHARTGEQRNVHAASVPLPIGAP